MKLYNLYQNTFSNPGIVPYKSDRFLLRFYYEQNNFMNLNNLDQKYEALETSLDLGINVTLPSVEYKIVSRKWFGGVKSDRVINSYEGSTSISFLYKQNTQNPFLDFLSKDKKDNFNPAYYPQTAFHMIKIFLIPPKMTKTIPCYTLHNCYVTKVSMPELNYETEEFIKLTLEIHYDYWELDEVGDY